MHKNIMPNQIHSTIINRNGDCANFVSQCLYAGKFSPMRGDWYSYRSKSTNWNGRYTYSVSETWRISKKLRFWLVNKMHLTQHLYTSWKSMKKDIKSIKIGAVAFMSTDYNGELTHTVLVGKITKNNIYYYAHTNSRNALDKESGFAEYFNNKKKGGIAMIAVFFLHV